MERMMITKKLPLLALTLSLVLTSRASFAGYKDAFTSNSWGDGAQLLLGVGDIVAAVANGFFITFTVENHATAIKERPDLSKNIAKAQEDLKLAESLTTHQERLKTTRKMLAEVERFKANPSYEVMLQKTQAAIAEIESKPIYTEAEKNLAIQTAKINLAQVKYKNMKEAIKVGKAGMIKNVSILGETIFILDVFQRIYVYNSLSKDPTFSPSLTFIAHQVFPSDAK